MRPERWINKAEEDEQVATLIFENHGPEGLALFHLQQMAEKLLKALLVHYNIQLVKTHDLLLLVEKLAHVCPKLAAHKLTLSKLTQYYTEARYPGDVDNYTVEEYEEARETTKNLKKFIQQQLT